MAHQRTTLRIYSKSHSICTTARGGERRTGITSHLYLLLPLYSSVTFAVGILFASKAIQRGATPWTGTFYANLWLGVAWTLLALTSGEIAPVSEWPKAAIVGLLFFLGQFFTYLAFRFGDVSVAAPIFGVKILFVAVLSSLTASEQVSPALWVSAAVATCGVALVQWNPRRIEQRHHRSASGLTVCLAVTAALCLSVFDILLQSWGPAAGTQQFLPIVFASAALLSCALLPWIDGFAKLRERGALRPMLSGSVLMALQAVGMCVALSAYGNPTRVNVVYALRGLWAVGLAWLLAQYFEGGERHAPRTVMLLRVAGALLLTAAVVAAIL